MASPTEQIRAVRELALLLETEQKYFGQAVAETKANAADTRKLIDDLRKESADLRKELAELRTEVAVQKRIADDHARRVEAWTGRF